MALIKRHKYYLNCGHSRAVDIGSAEELEAQSSGQLRCQAISDHSRTMQDIADWSRQQPELVNVQVRSIVPDIALPKCEEHSGPSYRRHDELAYFAELRYRIDKTKPVAIGDVYKTLCNQHASVIRRRKWGSNELVDLREPQYAEVRAARIAEQEKAAAEEKVRRDAEAKDRAERNRAAEKAAREREVQEVATTWAVRFAEEREERFSGPAIVTPTWHIESTDRRAWTTDVELIKDRNGAFRLNARNIGGSSMTLAQAQATVEALTAAIATAKHKEDVA